MEAAFFLPCHALKTHPVVHEITHKFCRRPHFSANPPDRGEDAQAENICLTRSNPAKCSAGV